MKLVKKALTMRTDVTLQEAEAGIGQEILSPVAGAFLYLLLGMQNCNLTVKQDRLLMKEGTKFQVFLVRKSESEQASERQRIILERSHSSELLKFNEVSTSHFSSKMCLHLRFRNDMIRVKIKQIKPKTTNT